MTDTVELAGLERWIKTFAALIAEHRDVLTDLDSAIGDGDHGQNMDRGLQAVVAAIEDTKPVTASALFTKAGMTLVSTVGGASGPLFGTMFLRIGTSLGETTEFSLRQLAVALRAGLDGVLARGKAAPGEKTMVDALDPAVTALEAAAAAGQDKAEALRLAAAAADSGRDATVAMIARKGRASYLGERSAGHQDPGATSVALLVQAAVRAPL
jgi:dihydroxyacetone kinase-like protein